MRHCIWDSRLGTRGSQLHHRTDRVRITVRGKYRRYQRKERGLWALMAVKNPKIVSHSTSIRSYSPKVDTSPTHLVLKIARQFHKLCHSKNHWTRLKTWSRTSKSKEKDCWGRLVAGKLWWLIPMVQSQVARSIPRALATLLKEAVMARAVAVLRMAAWRKAGVVKGRRETGRIRAMHNLTRISDE